LRVLRSSSRGGQSRECGIRPSAGKIEGTLGKRNLIWQIRSPKDLDEEEPQRRGRALDSPGRQLPVATQMNLALPYVVWAQALGRAMEVIRRVFQRVDLDVCSSLRVIATLEFIQHALPKMGHGKPPATRGLHNQQYPGTIHAAASVAPAT